jgi:hypothetical protein
MTDKPRVSIHTLIERSSLGTEKARIARARVPLTRGQAVARAAAARAADRSIKMQHRKSRQG